MFYQEFELYQTPSNMIKQRWVRAGSNGPVFTSNGTNIERMLAKNAGTLDNSCSAR